MRDEQAEVVVWGGGTGGVAAALQAARGGAGGAACKGTQRCCAGNTGGNLQKFAAIKCHDVSPVFVYLMAENQAPNCSNSASV